MKKKLKEEKKLKPLGNFKVHKVPTYYFFIFFKVAIHVQGYIR